MQNEKVLPHSTQAEQLFEEPVGLQVVEVCRFFRNVQPVVVPVKENNIAVPIQPELLYTRVQLAQQEPVVRATVQL